MKVDIICPLYNSEDTILTLKESIEKQKDVKIGKLRFVLTESSDKSEQILKDNKIDYKKISKEEFSHSKTREDEAMESDADVVVFITQDIEIQREDWLYNLVNPILSGEVDACFSRQLPKYNNIEKYTREKNYPAESYINSKDDLETKGLRTFFFSDASSAIKTETFKKLGGYDGKRLPISEDMYIAYKLIMNGYKIKYCADSEVVHSHKFTLKEIYDRYRLTGRFMAENSYLDQYGTTKTGGGLAKYILIRSLKEFNVKVWFRFLPDMMARWFGMKKGRKDAKNLIKSNKAMGVTK